MSKRRKYPVQWEKQWFELRIYPSENKFVAFFQRSRFFVKATTPSVAIRKLKKVRPDVDIMTVASFNPERSFINDYDY